MNRLPPAQRCALYALFGALFATGIAWEAMSPAPLAALAMKIHGAAGMLMLVLLGMLLMQHVPAGWAAGANRKSGVLVLGSLAWLALTGYLLYYAGGEVLRSYAAQCHLWVGVAAAGIVGWHIRRARVMNPGRRSISAAPPAPRARAPGRSSR
jgi:hypothetical protein